MTKKQIILAVVVLIVFGGLVYITTQAPKVPVDDNNTVSQQKEDRPKMPPFIIGKVSAIEGSKIIIKFGDDAKMAIVTDQTKFISQVKDGESYKNIEATSKDVKVGQEIVVYHSGSNVGGEYPADRIQILPFK